MAIQRLPVRTGLYEHSAEYTLDDVTYTFTFHYNQRIDSWTMDIGEEVLGLRLVGGVDLLTQFKHLNVPQGKLFLEDQDGLGREANLELFGGRVVLLYEELG